MKKGIIRRIILTLLLMFSLAACGQPASKSGGQDSVNPAESSELVSSEGEGEEASTKSEESSQSESKDEVQSATEAESVESESEKLDEESDYEEVRVEEEPDPPASQGYTYEDFEGLYITFTGEVLNSYPEFWLEIVPGEIRPGWPQSEYMIFRVNSYDIVGPSLYAETTEIGFHGEEVGHFSMEFVLDDSSGRKTLYNNGYTYYNVSQSEYDTFVQMR